MLSEDHARSVSYLRKALERTPERVIEMPNGVDTEVFSPGRDTAGVRAELGIPHDAVVAAFVATLDRAHHFKRLDVAIEALARARSQELHLSSPAAASCSRASAPTPARPASATASTSSTRCRTRICRTCSAPATPSSLTTEPPESFGIVLIEALACGLPAVATDYPGVRAVIDEGETGFLVPAGDSGAAADALDKLVDMGRRGPGADGCRGPAALPSSAGPGRRCSTAWTTPTRRRSPPGARSSASGSGREPGERPGACGALDPADLLLLPADPRHGRPAPGGDGQVPVPARAPGDGADDEGVRRARRPAPGSRASR